MWDRLWLLADRVLSRDTFFAHRFVIRGFPVMNISDYAFIAAWIGGPIAIGLLLDRCLVIIWDALLELLKAYARR